MKIAYGLLTGKSGNDIYFDVLAQTQKKLKHTISNISFHRNFSICPSLLTSFIKIPEDIDIIHSNIEYGFAFKKKNKPLVVSALHVVTEKFLAQYYNPAQRLYYRNVLKFIKESINRAQHIVTISQATAAQIKSIANVKSIQTIYCGVDTKLFQPVPIKNDPHPDKIKLLFVGNLTKRKGADLLPQIMAKLDDRFLLFYTTGMRTASRNFSDKRMVPISNLKSNELVYWYNLCDILILPTRLEGFGYAVAEAMACGKPVVTTKCSSLPEIVIDGKNGFLCKIDDSSDFVDKIKLLTDNKLMRQEMGIRNRERIVINFNLEKMGNEYNQMYQKVLEEFH